MSNPPALKSVVSVDRQWESIGFERNIDTPRRHARHRRRSPSPPSIFLPSSVSLAINPSAPTGLSSPTTETRRVFLKRKLPDEDERHIHTKEKPPIEAQEERRVTIKRANNSLKVDHDSSRKGDEVNSVSNSIQLSSEVNVSRVPILNRNETCPILIRIFYSTNGRHIPLSLFANGKLPHPEIQVNTWIDASLRELARELRDVCPLARRKGSRLQFATVFPDSQRDGAYRRRNLGTIVTGQAFYSSNLGIRQSDMQPLGDAFVTLQSKHFQIGDFLDVAISDPPFDNRGFNFDNRTHRRGNFESSVSNHEN